jgi:hypothetical protein
VQCISMSLTGCSTEVVGLAASCSAVVVACSPVACSAQGVECGVRSTHSTGACVWAQRPSLNPLCLAGGAALSPACCHGRAVAPCTLLQSASRLAAEEVCSLAPLGPSVVLTAARTEAPLLQQPYIAGGQVSGGMCGFAPDTNSGCHMFPGAGGSRQPVHGRCGWTACTPCGW